MTTLGPAPIRDAIDVKGQSTISRIWEKWFSLIHSAITEARPKAYPIRVTAANDSLNPATDCILLVNCTTGNKAIAGPAYAKIENGQPFCIKKTDSSANTVTISDPDGKTFDGSATVELTVQNEFVWIVPDGTNWQIV